MLDFFFTFLDKFSKKRSWREVIKPETGNRIGPAGVVTAMDVGADLHIHQLNRDADLK